MPNLNKNNSAFTLIELLVVIAIVGILSSIVLAALSGARESARDIRRGQEIRQIQIALEMHYNNKGYYPDSREGSNIYPNNSWSNSSESSWDSLASNLEPYISPLPEDPINTTGGWASYSETYNYNYFSANSGGCYMLVYRLENEPAEDTSSVSCGGTYEYGGPAVRTIGVES